MRANTSTQSVVSTVAAPAIRFTRRPLALAVGGVLALLAQPALAANCTLVANGDWGTGSNWDCGVRPGTPNTADSATINGGGAVDVSQAEQIRTLNNAGTIDIDAFLLTLLAGAGAGTTNTGVINVGGGSTAALNINAAHNVDNSGGMINVANGSVVNQFGSTITGGTISTSGTGALVAFSSGSNFLDGVTLAGTLDMASNASSRERVINGLTLTNGTVNVNSNGTLVFQGTQTVGGTGEIVFGATGAGNRVDLDGAGDTTLGSGVVIRGQNGTIGQQLFVSGTQTLINEGLISADVAAGTITITQSDVTNNSTLEARNGGTLTLGSNVDSSGGGLILADNGVVLQSASRITGGTIDSANGGVFRATSSAFNFLDAVVVDGDIDMQSVSSSRERVANGLTLNGTLAIDNNGILSFEGTSTLGGTGEVVFGATGPGNRLDLDGAGTTTFGANMLVHGENGTIGRQLNISGTQTLVNNGRISADVSGGTLTITESSVTNNGTLEAINGGTLVLSSNVTGGVGSQIVAGAGSNVFQSGVSLSGEINTSGSGVFSMGSSAANFLDGVTFNGNLDMTAASARERVTAGGLTLNGTIDINSNAILSFEGNGTLDGNAMLVFGATGPGNRIDLDGAGTTTFGSNVVVRGQNGTIGQHLNISGTQTLVNNGLVSADVGGGTITITQSEVTNNATLEARNGATLVLNSDVTQSASGQILADNGVVVQSAATIDGGTVDSANGGVLRATTSGANFLSGVTLAGTLDMATNASSRERVTGGLVLDGVVNLNNNAILSFEGTQTVSGSGEIVLGATGAGNRVDLDGSGTTTFGPGVTLRGHSGTIGNHLNISGTQTLHNQGTIDADGGGTLTFAQSALVNDGVVRASNGTIDINVATSGTGTLQADATGIVDVSAASTGDLTQGSLVMGGSGAQLNLGNNDITLNTDYTNVGAGSGNAFNRRAGVSGAGQILAGGDVAQAINGSNVTNGNTPNATLTINNVRVGATTFDYQVANTGTTGPTLRGAIQDAVNGGNITDARLSGAGVTAANYNAGGPGGDTGNLGVTFTAASAGVLAALTGQAVNLRSNFDNIADQRLNIVLGAGAAAFNAAVGSAAPTPIVLGNQRVGAMAPPQLLTVSNTAAAGAFTEGLNASFGSNSGDAINNAGSVSLLAGGASDSSSMAVNVSNASAGAKSGTVTLNYQTDGTGSSGLAAASVGSQTISVSGNVYNLAQASVGPTSIALANQRIGGTNSQALSVGNTDISPAGFQEGLDADFGSQTGDVQTNSGSISNLAQGASNATAMAVGVDTASAGAKSGTVNVLLASNGNTTSGLGTQGLASQSVNVSGSVFALAAGQLNTAPLAFGTVQVGQTVMQTLSVSNTATGAAGFVEDLNVSFGATSGTGAGLIGGSGQVNGLLAGATDAASMVVTVNTAAAGTVNGSIAIDYFSAGAVNGVSNGLGVFGVGSDSYGVSGVIQTSGNVVDQANPLINSPVIALGNVRIGTASPNANVSVTNVASGNQQAALNAVITGNAPITASGSFNQLLPGGTDAASLQVGMDTATAGLKNGTATVAFVSDANNIGNCAPNCEMNLAPQDVNVSGAVYRLANGQAGGSVDLGARRVGDAAASATISVTNVSADAFTEALNVAIGAGTPSAPFSATGSIGGLAAGATDSASLNVSMDTVTAGIFSDGVNLEYVSTGVGTTGAADIAAGGQSVGVSGRVYAPAIKQLDTASVDFGIVHVGDVIAAQSIGVTNAATVAALNDTMHASTGVLAPGFTGGGSVGGLGAGASGALSVGLNTSTAGVFGGPLDIGFVSQNPDMADLDLGAMQVALSGQVNNYANPAFVKSAGAGSLTGSNILFSLDLGNVTLGDSRTTTLAMLNDVIGPADLLGGSYTHMTGLDGFFDFNLTGFDIFNNLLAGDMQGGLNVSFLASSLGTYSDTVELIAMGFNASGFNQPFNVHLVLNATVVAGGGNGVPLPGTLLLIGPMVLLVRRWVKAG